MSDLPCWTDDFARTVARALQAPDDAPTAEMNARSRAVGEAYADHDVDAPDVETASDAYAARFRGPLGGWLLEVQSRLALDLLGMPPNPLRILDVGGGHGQLTDALIGAGHRVVVHGSRSSCHDRLRKRGTPVRFVTSSLTALPFASGSFDLVIAVRLMAHARDWRSLLRELARVSCDRVLIDYPQRSRLLSGLPFLFGAKRLIEGNTRPFFEFDTREVSEALHGCGLVTLGTRHQFSIPMAFHRALGSPRVSRVAERMASRVGLTERIGSPVLMMACHRSMDSH